MYNTAFQKAKIGSVPLWEVLNAPNPRGGLEEVAQALDYLHMDAGLLRPYEQDYPLVESRELVPPFDAPLIEYRHLPAFSMVALDRPLSYQDEGFQFDLLHPEGHPPDRGKAAANRQTLRQRMPRNLVPQMEKALGLRGPTPVKRYIKLLPLLMAMDRGHVLARDQEYHFHMAGIFASFPSDLDGEIKRFGRQVGKFSPGDNQGYAQNRQFVYAFLMEQSGFPICGERHTSAALFARRLMRRRENFLVKVLGHSDRAITTLTSLGGRNRLPRVEKVALVGTRTCNPENLRRLRESGFMVDKRRGVVLLRVHYMPHAYHKDNVLEERALSVSGQEVIHPETGEVLAGMDVLGLGQDRMATLNDIVRGEHLGSIVYEGRETINTTADAANRLKFLAAWLKKHRYMLADYTPDRFERCSKAVFSYLNDPGQQDEFLRNQKVYGQVRDEMRDINWAHRLRLLEKLVGNRADAYGRRLKHVQILIILVHVLSQEGQSLAKRHPRQLAKLLSICRGALNNSYLKRRYLDKSPSTTLEREVVGHYKLLDKLIERFGDKLED